MKRSGALWRRAVLVFTLLAFVQAGYVTQTHIHIPAAPSGSTISVQTGGKAPLPDDPAHCPICQEYLLSGAYFTPPPIVLPLPVSVAATLASVVDVSRFVATLSHSWYGRAPPLT
ncbi:MAG TPA: hypothetical protein VKR31_02245 [Rhizomicrobium sp.]|nr:hypothetical protein [Rhizomicrobium sp.]